MRVDDPNQHAAYCAQCDHPMPDGSDILCAGCSYIDDDEENDDD